MEDVTTRTQVMISRCFNAIGISILLYDHLLSVDDEVEYVWKARMSVPKLSFLLVRYLVPVALFVNIYQQSYDNISLPDTLCLSGLASCNSCIFHYCRRGRKFFDFTSSLVMTIGWTIAIMVKEAESMHFAGSRKFHTVLCSTQSRSILPALYAAPVVFEIVMIVLILWGAYVQSRNMENKNVMRHLMNDGFIYIMLLFVLRVANMLVTASAPSRLIFTGLCFGCATSAATISRLILSVRKESVTKRRLGMSSRCPME
ncbi:hypothetical protein Agabi119p4_10491 [Agaricus bisporus var. burnettii]|uniref:DUF6533 domain-containing protein n=1 Tax=Agaricus bisporus var. burnettii TaxID=192524 RepID=A0A8H7EWN1_AGABI|nr:hypothetical protein Agabi119p4_10491 [Agaricus bisporus var. burnettii]